MSDALSTPGACLAFAWERSVTKRGFFTQDEFRYFLSPPCFVQAVKCPARLRGCPWCVRGETKVVSMASWVPPIL